MQFGIKLEGAQKLDKLLGQLPKKVGRKVVNKAIKKAARPMMKEQKSNAVSMVGGKMGKALRRFIGLRQQKKRKPGDFGFNILIRKQGNPFFVYYPKGSSSSLATRKTTGRRTYIPAAIEYGHGTAKPIPFMRKAYHKLKRSAIKMLHRELWAGIKREAKAK